MKKKDKEIQNMIKMTNLNLSYNNKITDKGIINIMKK